MSKWAKPDSDALTTALEKVLAENRFWPEQVHHNLISKIVPLAATEVAVVKDGKLLLQYRLFDEWPAPYNKPGWYMPGGYCFWPADLGKTCLTHLLKDMKGEYKRVGIECDLDQIQLTRPTVIATKKWMPGEHPLGCPISMICVCELVAGEIIETDWLKWSAKTVPTDVPWHRSFQAAVHFYLNSPSQMKRWLAEMHSRIDTIT